MGSSAVFAVLWPPTWLLLAASGSYALFVIWIAAVLIRFMTATRPDHLLPSDAERDRRKALRAASHVYRWFEPTVDALARFHRERQPHRVDRVALDLSIMTPPHLVRWRPEEYLAFRELVGFGWALLAAGAGYVFCFGPIGVVVFATVTYAVWYWVLMLRGLHRKAARYRADIRVRLPYAVELMALMLESGGADIRDAMPEVIRENRGHPLGYEFGLVVALIRDGLTPDVALQGMADRVRDDDVYELASTIRMAEGIGGQGIQATLRNLAEQMRTRRVQRLERAAEEAKLHITWPGMGIMLACLIIVAAPFVLAGWFSVNN